MYDEYRVNMNIMCNNDVQMMEQYLDVFAIILFV